MRVILGVAVLSACWSSNPNKALERKVDVLAAELARSRGDVEVLERQVQDLSDDRVDRAELVVKLEQLEQKLAALAQPTAPTAAPPPPRRYRPGPDPAKVYSVPLGKAYVEGRADAKVTMVVAHEYACPYCFRVRAALAELRQKYGRDLRIAYKQLVVHPQTATASALAICAANRQRKHAQLDALLWSKGFEQRTFDKPTQLPDGTSQNCWEHVDGCPVVIGFAREARLNIARFKRDMATRCVTELADTARELQALGVRATPSFFINGRFTSGAQPASSFAKLIDEELAKATERIKKGTPKARYYQRWVVDAGEKPGTP